MRCSDFGERSIIRARLKDIEDKKNEVQPDPYDMIKKRRLSEGKITITQNSKKGVTFGKILYK